MHKTLRNCTSLLTCSGFTAYSEALVFYFQLLSARFHLRKLLLHLKQTGLQRLPLRPAGF